MEAGEKAGWGTTTIAAGWRRRGSGRSGSAAPRSSRQTAVLDTRWRCERTAPSSPGGEPVVTRRQGSGMTTWTTSSCPPGDWAEGWGPGEVREGVMRLVGARTA